LQAEKSPRTGELKVTDEAESKPTFRNAKFEATGETKNWLGVTLHRIRAVAAIPALFIAAGDLGGWIEKEGCLQICGDAWISGNAHAGWFTKVGSENGTLTWFLDGKGAIYTNRWCFFGTLDEFSAAVKSRHGGTQIGIEYNLLIEFIRLRAAPITAERVAAQDTAI